jgi:hypothetical protein
MLRSAKLVVGVVSAALLTACSSDGGGPLGDNTRGATDAASPSMSSPSSKPPAFEDFPGEGVVFSESGSKVGVKTKAIDATWTAEVLGTPAKPGHHYLTVWVAVTPELPDRGAEKVSINRDFYVRYKSAAGTCVGTQPATSGYCYFWGWPGSQLSALENDQWRDHQWESSEYVSNDVKRGETRIGQVGFEIADTVQPGEFELCVPTREALSDKTKFPCTPVKAPDGSR